MLGTDPQETLQACRQFKLISVVYQRNKPFLLRTMSFWYICYSVHILEYLIKNTNTKSLKEAEKGNTFLLLHIEQLLLHLVHFPFSLLHHSPSHIYLRPDFTEVPDNLFITEGLCMELSLCLLMLYNFSDKI